MKQFAVKCCFIAVVAAGAAISVYSADLCSGESATTTIDLATGVRTAVSTERIYYSTDWIGDVALDATAEICVDGVALNSGTGTGYVDWTPDRNGTYTLTHKVKSGGSQVGETLTAVFIVGPKPEAPVIYPGSRTIFKESQMVLMSCPTEGARIYYTTNGVDPTVESVAYRRFRIYGKTTVKAAAEKDGVLSDVTTAEYALGQCVDPAISLADGAEFAHSNQVVSIRWNNDGVLRYTLDGSDPTAGSRVYDGPFAISESVAVKAKVFSDDFFDSAVVTSQLARVWVNAPMPAVDAVPSFTGSKTKVSISCAAEGAVVRYTLDGSEPDAHSTKYTEPFYVTDSCTVKAYAVAADYLASGVATFAIEKIRTVGDAMGKPDHRFTTDGDGGAGWIRVKDVTAPGGEAMKSGAITHNQTSSLSTTTIGPGTLSFLWRTSCEEDAEFKRDHIELLVDGTVRQRLNGVTGWTGASVEISGDGEHAIEWRYVKDDVESEESDAAWVANYNWMSAWTATRTTSVPVPYAWLAAHDPGVVDEYESYEAEANATGANGRKVWESYVLGLDPMDATSDFKIVSFPMKADGMPDLDAIAIWPPKSQWNIKDARPVLKGKSALGVPGEWQPVTEENKARMRFFKVDVVLP